jgi:single-stranded-DNA-specific exonuclease
MEKRWKVLSDGKDLRETLLKNRKIGDSEKFFKPHLNKLTSPSKFFSTLEKAVERIKKAILDRELIYIYGDFDADGLTATAILWETINFLGGKVLPYIPHRGREGYGLNTSAIEWIAQQGAKLIITVDCGIGGVAEAKTANKLGVGLIITDHHEEGKALPDCFAILHTKKLSGSGISFMLAKAILEDFNKGDDSQLSKNLELATIGTIADLSPLLEDNRVIVANGLHNLINTERVGLRSIYEEAGINKKITPYEVGFIIAPRLNATGRMEHAITSLRLLLTKKKERAGQLAKKLSLVNRQRQDALAAALEHAKGAADTEGNIIFANHSSYPAGVIGLVAGKLADQFYKPAIVISEAEGLCKGSARSINGFDIVKAIRSAEKHLIDVGGHAMAAGFTIEKEKIVPFQKSLLSYAEKNLKKKTLSPVLEIDTKLDSSDLNTQTLDLIKEFEPFGVGNRDPLFLTEGLRVANVKNVGRDGKHIKAYLYGEDGNVYDSVGFGLAEKEMEKGSNIDVVYSLNEDSWSGNNKLQLKIKDFRNG